MKKLILPLLAAASVCLGLVSCVAPAYVGDPGYSPDYGGPSVVVRGPTVVQEDYYHDDHYHNDRYRDDRDRNDRYRDDHRHKESVHHDHCYCSHKNCGCRSGHPKDGCSCDHGAHRH